MPLERLEAELARQLQALDERGTRKGAETVIIEITPANAMHGPRYRLEGEPDRLFLRMSSNGYLGLALSAELAAAEEQAVRRYGTGPQAVRFIGGTYRPHIELESKLAAFHRRPAAMVFSSAYAAVMGILPTLVTPETAVISDALNHNCIINAVRLSQPAQLAVYPHLDLGELQAALHNAAATCRRALVVTDGVFSMRGDHAPLDEISAVVREADERYAEGVCLVVDDSHGVGAFGRTGRGTEEVCSTTADILIATLGKALGVNGGYVVGNPMLIDYLRETCPLYIYSNPITPAEAEAARCAVDLLAGEPGQIRLAHLRAMTERFQQGVIALGYETIPGEHPVVPLMVRETDRTRELVRHLHANRILATGLHYPVVPKGDEEVRFQVSADHTAQDIDQVLDALASFPH